MYYVYILRSETCQRYYIGSTGDLERRLNQHNSSKKGFTSVGGPWKLVYSAEYKTKSEALKRERYLKRMKSAKFIESLLKPGKRSMDA
jgi:putative endonuclease